MAPGYETVCARHSTSHRSGDAVRERVPQQSTDGLLIESRCNRDLQHLAALVDGGLDDFADDVVRLPGIGTAHRTAGAVAGEPAAGLAHRTLFGIVGRY